LSLRRGSDSKRRVAFGEKSSSSVKNTAGTQSSMALTWVMILPRCHDLSVDQASFVNIEPSGSLGKRPNETKQPQLARSANLNQKQDSTSEVDFFDDGWRKERLCDNFRDPKMGDAQDGLVIGALRPASGVDCNRGLDQRQARQAPGNIGMSHSVCQRHVVPSLRQHGEVRQQEA
jgi:hypothetical protein